MTRVLARPEIHPQAGTGYRYFRDLLSTGEVSGGKFLLRGQKSRRATQATNYVGV